MLVALLVCVSLNEQSCDRQVRELTEYAKSQQWEIVAVIKEKIFGRKTRLMVEYALNRLQI